MADPFGGLAVWFVRYLFLTLFGGHFRQAPLPILAMLLLFVTNQLKELDHEHILSWDGGSLIQFCGSPDVQTWVQTAFTATLTILLLDNQPPRTRYACRGLCSIALVSHVKFWQQAIPFLKSLSFWIVFIISAYYHYSSSLRLPRDVQTCCDTVIEWIRSTRKAVTSENGLSQTDIEQAVKDVQTGNAQSDPVAQAGRTNREKSDSNEMDQKRAKLMEYNPLAEDDIRLLEVVPRNSDDSDRLEFTLLQRALPKVKDEYTALSYFWGNASQQREIIIDQVVVPVAANLYEALREMCRLDLAYPRFWVDAVSINQQDMQERSAQVLRMLAIYRSAREVVAWLGPEDSESKSIMTHLRGMSESSPRHFAKGEFSLDDLKKFVGREFWRRIWIIQELAAATEICIVCCGEKISLDLLRPLLDEMKNRKDVSQGDWPHFFEEMQLIENILDIRSRLNDLSRPLSLLELLAKTKASRSTRSHDRVYGLLGLAMDSQLFMPEPNYDTTEDELCIDMTRSWISSKRCLDIILAAPRHGTQSHLPSWCPDFLNAANQPFNEDMVHYLAGRAERFRLGEKRSFWNVTKDSRATLGQTFTLIRNRILEVDAIHVGTIDGVGPIPDRGNRNFQLLRRETSASQHQRPGRKPSIPTNSPYDAVCRMLLIYDPGYSEFTAAPIVLGMLYHFLQAYNLYAAVKGGIAEDVLKWLKANKDFSIHGRKLKDRAQTSAMQMSKNFTKGLFNLRARTMMFWHYGHIAKYVAEIIKERMSLMTTKEGGVGWAHPDANLGDEIFLITGCSLPVILRKCDGPEECYQVVGHGYLDGCMDGKRWDETQDRVRVSIC